MLEQFRDEPAETEFRAGRAQRVRVRGRFFFRSCQRYLAGVARFELAEGQDGVAGLPLLVLGDAVAFHS